MEEGAAVRNLDDVINYGRFDDRSSTTRTGIVKVVSSLFTFTCGTTFFLVGVNVGIRQ